MDHPKHNQQPNGFDPRWPDHIPSVASPEKPESPQTSGNRTIQFNRLQSISIHANPNRHTIRTRGRANLHHQSPHGPDRPAKKIIAYPIHPIYPGQMFLPGITQNTPVPVRPRNIHNLYQRTHRAATTASGFVPTNPPRRDHGFRICTNGPTTVFFPPHRVSNKGAN